MKNRIKQMALLIGIALTVSAQAQTRMPKPVTDNLPGLPGQTDEWWAEYRKAQAEENARKKQARTADGESNFYTGKPYDAEIGGYVFKYRNYSPETQRWTTADPSGFPDGANNYRYVTVPTYGFDPLGLKIAYVIYINSNDSWPYTNAGSRDDLRSACDNFRSNLENIDSETYNSVSDPGTLYLKDSGNIQKDSLVFAQVNTLTDLVNYLIGDVKLYIAGHVTYEITGYYMDGAIGEPIYSNIWHFIGTEKHSAIEIMNVIGDSSWGDIGGCLFGFPAFANDIINQFEQGIKNYLYE